MSFLILRTAKIKSVSELEGSAGHNFRERRTPNADSSRIHKNQHLFANSVEEIKNNFEKRYEIAAETAKKTGKKIRSDAVLCIEYMITASPEAFQNQGFNDKKYFGDALKFLQKKHGTENIIGASIHRDETTPHLVVYAVPLDSKQVFNCKSFLGGAKLLSQLQTDAHKEFGISHGLQRGIMNSAAEHIPVREFYKKVHAAQPTKPQPLPNVPEPSISDRIFESIGIETEHSKIENSVMEQAKKQIAILKKQTEIQDAKLKIYDLQKSNFERERRENSKFKEEAKMRAAHLRELPLTDVLNKFGIQTQKNDKNNFSTERGRITITGQKFFNHNENKGGGGAIDLVMHLQNCEYKQAISVLSNEFGNDFAIAAVAKNPVAAAAAIINENPIKSSIPDDSPTNWQTVRAWLNGTRKIAFSIIDEFKKQGILRADSRGNAVFVNREKNGAEIRGKGLNFKGYRGERGLVIYTKNENEKTCFIVESGTDAMAFASSPKSSCAGLICSVGGDFGQKTIEQLKALQHKGFQLIIGTDNDESGDEKFKRLKKELTTNGKVILREKPRGRDWQDDIRQELESKGKIIKGRSKFDTTNSHQNNQNNAQKM